MRESVYEQISRELGTSHDEVEIPSLVEAEKLKCQVELRNREAFFEVYKIFRFCGYANTDSEQYALETIVEAFRIGQNIFQNMYEHE